MKIPIFFAVRHGTAYCFFWAAPFWPLRYRWLAIRMAAVNAAGRCSDDPGGQGSGRVAQGAQGADGLFEADMRKLFGR